MLQLGVAGRAELSWVEKQRLNKRVKSRGGTHTDSEQVRGAGARRHLYAGSLPPRPPT